MMFLSPRQEARLLAKVRQEAPDKCWEWAGNRWASGYGRFFANGHYQGAHRVMYELFVAPAPPELDLDHLCRNRACVNPGHLEPVTRQVNVLRGVGMGARYAARTECPKGHPLDGLAAGRRYCRTCRREAYEPRPRLLAPACPKGHPRGDSPYRHGGQVHCRQCRTERMRLWREANQERWREICREAAARHRAKNRVL